MALTKDRGHIIHFAGFKKLSPALQKGAPALVGQNGPGERCGWEAFFRAMDERRLAASLSEDGAARFVLHSTKS